MLYLWNFTLFGGHLHLIMSDPMLQVLAKFSACPLVA
jgi:hypothetical protein